MTALAPASFLGLPAAGLPVEWRISTTLVEYPQAMAAMEERVQCIIDGIASECVWLLEHPPLYTMGTGAAMADLLDRSAFPVFQAGRGGQFTYHGPGQRIAYAMLDLKRRAAPQAPDLRAYVSTLEQWLIATLIRFGIEGFTRPGRIGVWTDDPARGEAKIAALGIRIRKWVAYHGIALNVNPDLSHYAGIVPCGIKAYGVTSLAALGVDATMAEVDAALREEFSRLLA